ncbi:MAG: serine/threonine-protein kinase [Acidobacteriota bacterium]
MASTDDQRFRADRIFKAALDLEPEERAGYLRETCAGDGDLRQLVERLIANVEMDEETEIMPGGGMDGPLWDGLMVELGGDDENTPPGTVIGRYRVVREIGRGGMAVVYLAERADGQFRQHVALKRIRRGIDTIDVIRRFDQERQILASTQHPNIAQLVDGGVGPDGRPYFVMEYVEGRSIDVYCDEERLSVNQRLELFLQVARAVDYAHRNLVVHRDIKPTNILVTADGHAKLLDFGIAKLLDAEGAPGETPLTRSYTRLMTPVYASPEQVRGTAVTTASDIYQLGLLLYELLTGRWPYHLTEQRPVAVAKAICEDEPTRPSTALWATDTYPHDGEQPSAEAIGDARSTSAARLRRQLSGDLDNIALTALRKEPSRRYGAVAQLIDDVESFLVGHPVSARSDSFVYRAEKLIQRHKAAFTTAAAALLLLVALAIFYTFQLARERDRAQLAAAQAEQVSDFLSRLFMVSAPTRSKGEQITARQLLDRGAGRIEGELAGQGELQAAMMTLMGNVYRELALYDEARPLLERAVGLRRENPDADALELAESLHALAQLYEDEGDHTGAQARFEEALELREDAEGGDATEIAQSLSGLGRVLEAQAAFEQARRYHERAIALFESTVGPDHPEVGRCLQSLGRVHQRTRHFDEAQAALERALRIFERSYESDHPYIADTRVALANVLRSTRDAAGARAQYERALPLLERAYGPDHPAVAVALESLGKLLNAADEAEAAIAYHQRALAIREAAFEPNHWAIASSLNNLGLAQWRQRDSEAARRSFERSAEVFELAYGPDHVDVSKPLHSLAEILQRIGEYSAAEERYQRVIRIRERALGLEHSLLARPLYNYGRLQLEIGRPAAAEPLLRQALALGRGEGPNRHPEIIWPRIVLARALTSLGRYPEAEALLLSNLEEPEIDAQTRVGTLKGLVAVATARERGDEAARWQREIDTAEAAAESS